MKALLVSVSAGALVAMGCGGNVIDGTGAGTTTGTATSTSGTMLPDSGTCGVTKISIENGKPVPLDAICNAAPWNPTQSTVPIGYVFAGGPPPGAHDLEIQGCTSSAAGAEGISLSITNVSGPGTYQAASTTYTDPTGALWKSLPNSVQVDVMMLGAVGQMIEGNFGSHVTTGSSTLGVSGIFGVCHTEDEAAP